MPLNLRVQLQRICLEAEGYPDGANVPALGNIILQPGETRRHTTVYSFSNV